VDISKNVNKIGHTVVPNTLRG